MASNKLPVAFMTILAAAACSPQHADQPGKGGAPAVAATHAATETVRIPIEGMSCSSCAARVKRALIQMDGVTRVQVALAERRAEVQFVTGKVAAADIVAKINELGYRAGGAVQVK